MKKPRITAVVPAYNEEKTIGPVLKVLTSIDKINDVRDVEFSWTLEYVKKLLFGEKVLDMKFHEDVLPSTLS